MSIDALPSTWSPLKKFLDVAEANRVNNFMPCPCVECRNITGYSKKPTLQGHLVMNGFMPAIIVGPSTEKEGL